MDGKKAYRDMVLMEVPFHVMGKSNHNNTVELSGKAVEPSKIERR